LSSLNFHTARHGSVLVITVEGDLHFGTRSWLADFMDGTMDAGARVVVDLDGVSLCDATSMTMLLVMADMCRTRGGWLRLTGVGGLVGRAFAVVSLGQAVPVYATLAAAIAGDERERIKG
jgi:anti-anti-sigma factor